MSFFVICWMHKELLLYYILPICAAIQVYGWYAQWSKERAQILRNKEDADYIETSYRKIS